MCGSHFCSEKMLSYVACGNKVSPASLLCSNECSTDTGIMSGGESQFSQISLFSGSECANSQELFSQPPIHSQSNISSAPVCEHSETLSGRLKNAEAKISDGKKYYMRYLSSVSCAARQPQNVSDDRSVQACQSEAIASQVSFELWKEKQQEKFTRKDMIEEASRVMVGFAEETIGLLRKEIKDTLTEVKNQEERRAVEEKALYSSHLTQILKEQEETKRMVQELRSELRSEMTHQRALLKALSGQVSVLSSFPTETAANLTETLLPRLLAATALQQPPSSVAHISTQTMQSGSRPSEPPANNPQHLQGSGAGISDQSVPTILPPLPDSAEDERLFGKEGVGKCHQQPAAGLSSTNSSYSDSNQLQLVGSGTRSCMRYNMDPSPVYDLDLTQLPLLIERETCDSVRIERKVVYGKRHLVERSPFGLSKLKLPRKSITVASKEVGESRRDFEIRRKSKRNVKKIPSYCYSSSDSGEEEESSSRSPSFLQTKAHPFKAKLRRKVVSNIQGSRLFSHKTYVDSPVNALDDAFYSGSVTILHSAVGNSRDDHTGTLVEKEKFNRTNESVRRRLKVISSMTGAGMELQELENSILKNYLGNSEPSP